MEVKSNEIKKEKVILAGVHQGLKNQIEDTTEESMHELYELAKTAGAEVVAQVIQNKAEIESGTYMGEGKLEEIANAVKELSADGVIFDDELTPVQIRNITDILGVKVLDRSMLILDIFAMRAKSGEGKLQVELAQLKYRLPRLRGMGVEMSRTGGGIGTRGPGETKLESDRRHIHKRIQALSEELEELKKHRELLRGRRKKDGVITAALVGYTNAGKSTLLNALTDAQVFAEDKLFATLDPTSRSLELEDSRKILLVDTVGFIRKLPHHLVEAFKSTLEEAVVADILIHVVDASNEEYRNQITVVDKVLEEIGAVGKPEVMVYNKCDKAGETDISDNRENSISVFISAKYKKGLDKLINAVAEQAPGKKRELKICIPYSEGALVNELHDTQKVLSSEYIETGTQMVLLADKVTYDKLRKYITE
ncbi:MAG: GTPase HflX [Clostridia bacterium]|nr:GTPase HflX [Clostridia bacterium]